MKRLKKVEKYFEKEIKKSADLLQEDIDKKVLEQLSFKMERVKLKSKGKRKIDSDWKFFECPKCGEFTAYKGIPPKHNNCPGHMIVYSMMSKESEQELIDCIAEQIKKDIKNKIK